MQRTDATRVYYVFGGVSALADVIMFTVLALYYVQIVGMNPFQLVLVGTVLETTILVFEVPTGVLADAVSRRLSVIVGTLLLGIGWLLQGLLPSFGAVLATEALLGIGYTFQSGAVEAWVAGEIGDDSIGPIFIRVRQLSRLATLVAIPASVALASARLYLPVILGGVLYLGLAGYLAVTMPERGFTPTPRDERETWRGMAATFRDGVRSVRGRPLLIAILSVGVVAGAASEGVDRLWEAHLLAGYRFPTVGGFQPVVWFGVIAFVGTLLALVVTHLMRERMERASTDDHSTLHWLVALSGTSIAALVVFGAAGSFAVAVAAYLTRSLSGRLQGPLAQAWLVRAIEPKVRATVFSMASLTDALGQSAFGPIVGLVGTAVSTGAAMLTSAVLSIPTMALYLWALRRGPREATASRAVAWEGARSPDGPPGSA
jgi:MFS transporter, DHA3 family, tetracycline resistance protein